MDSLMTKEQLRQFIKNNNLKTAEDAQNALKSLFVETLQEMLEAEIEDHLGYSRNDTQGKKTTNRRNGRSKKLYAANTARLISTYPGTETVNSNLG